MKQIVWSALLLAAAAPGLSQSENEPYFALSSGRTFGANSRPSVSLSAWNVDSLEFRVYRVDDPEKFFEQIEDPHRFGGRAPQPPRERTMLERIHLWKHALRTQIRRSLRAQFTESPSAHFAAREAPPPKPAGLPAARGTHYAEAPLLNSQQLVLSFPQPVLSHSRWERETVEIGVKDRGVYLVEATRGDLRAYTILIVSDIAMITKTGKGRIVNLLVDRNSGEPIPSARIAMLTRDKQLAEAQTNGDGIAEMTLAAARPDDIRLVARRGGDFAVNALSGWAFGVNAEQWMGYVYTDRPVYRPGHTVHFKGILRVRNADGYAVPAGRAITVTINDPEQKPVYQKTLTASANGTIRDDLTLPPAAALGDYFIQVKSTDDFMSGNFEVQEYKKPEYDVRVTPSRTRVLQGDSIQATIEARYYFGEPVNGAKVTYAIYRERFWFPRWYQADEDFASEPGDDNGDGGDQVGETEGRLDADGKLTIDMPTSVSDHKFDFRYRIEARVTDQGNREITGRGYVIATYGSFLVNVAPEHYFYTPGSKARFTVQARDYDSNPVKTRAHIELQSWKPHQGDEWETKSATDVDLPDGSSTATLDIPAQGGSYRVRATARTPEGRDVEDRSYLWVSGGSGGDFRSARNRTVQIVPDRKS
ncbi:MAG TPA: MG2 domain-containing protein [Candidatus Sulfopaludibacter sp.]|nr:MG2 domain-containing protein [Candidatus Sulfopaludibacter sp.]